MSTSVPPCTHACDPAPVFPAIIDNRPGLPFIRYRIGTYADLRSHMLALLDRTVPLRAWTHRLPDDPGIALIESAAEVGDILSFYHELYANEAYLRTAKWRDSVADLVRLLGYRLSPGLAGRARFALAIKGDGAAVVPAGYPIKAQLEGDPKPAVFETSAPIVARTALSRFHLYRPRLTPPIRDGRDTFALTTADEAAVTLRAGDRIMVAAPQGNVAFDHLQVLIVDRTWESFGTTFVKTKGVLESLDTSLPSVPELHAWKLGSSIRHFGHNAPPRWVEIDAQNRATLHQATFARNLATNTGYPAVPAIGAREIPLDGEVSTLTAGMHVLIEAPLRPSNGSAARKLLLERIIAAVDRKSLLYAGLGSASTVLTLDAVLAIPLSGQQFVSADLRNMVFHQVDGAPFTLRAADEPTSDIQGSALDYFGLAEDAAALRERTVLLVDDDAQPRKTAILDVTPATGTATRAVFHRVTLDQEVTYARYGHDAPSVMVYGNVVDATQGKTEDEVALGDGDARVAFQTFPVPKPPLTYLLDTTQVPPQLPELTVWVNRIQWRRVASLYGHTGEEHIYVVREDADGKSYVQFGDGFTGSRVPSGRGNVVAHFRTGSGAHGPLAPDARPQADKRIAGVDAAFMFEPATGGAPPESEDGARMAAPGTMQSLGRIVSLADYEAEALNIPGVLKARAVWTPLDGAPVVRLTILTMSGSTADAAAAAEALRAAVAAHGAGRASLVVIQGTRRRVRVGLTVGFDSDRRLEDVSAALLLALGARGATQPLLAVEEGLFGWRRRQFGQGVHGSQIIAAVQNTEGVAWVRLIALGAVPTPVLVVARALPIAPFLLERLANASRRALNCDSDALLALDASDVSLTLSAVQPETLA